MLPIYQMCNSQNILVDAALAPDVAKAKVAAGGIFELIDQVSLIDYENPDGQRPDNIEGEVDTSNATFAYPIRPEQMILKG
jgi:ATP-binding cassette subfamily B (MDR/TAP) protein 1